MQNLPETYWSLVIESGWIQSAIWEINSEEKKAKVLAVSSPSRWESDEDLIAAADTALSGAASELPNETQEPSKTVFGVPSSWVEGGQIKEEYIDKIRKICASLSLEPSGFVVLPEAIAYFVKSNEGAPLNGIVVGIGSESLEIAVFKLGNLVGNVSVARSVSIAEDVMEGLVRFKLTDNLPSRILIFDGKEGQLDEARQALVSVDWLSSEVSEKVKFLHIPKVEIVEPKEKVLAVCLAGASEIGQALTVSFAGHEDVVDLEEEIPTVEKNFEESDITPEELGFISGADIKASSQMPSHAPVIENVQYAQEESRGMAPQINFPKVPDLKLPRFKLPILPHFRLPRFTMPKNGLIVGLCILGFVAIAGLLAWFILPKATVTVYVSPKKIDSSQNITLGTDLQTRQEELTVNGSKTVSVTGTKTVGDNAKGQVTIYNAADSVTLPAGTKVTDPSGLAFTLDNDTSVASGSGLLNLGTSTAAVTATDIGSQYNLASGTTFSVSGYASNELTAKNENSFSGGSSRDITAVSAEDRNKAETSLTAQLKEDGSSKIKEKISSDEVLIDDSVSATSSGKQFNHKVGDEASDLNLTMDMDIKGLVASKSDLNKIAMNALKDKVPVGFVLRANQITTEFTLVSGKKYKVKFTANLLPEIKTDDIVKKIVGKSPKDADSILSAIPGYTRSQITIVPRLGPLATLPHLNKNITVEVSSEK